MQEYSQRFLDAVQNGNATQVVRADVALRNRVIESDIPVLSGSISLDSTADIRRRMSMTIEAERSWIPSDPGDLLFPVGNEIAVRGGFRYDDGTEELKPCGVFRISRPVVTDGSEGVTLSIDGYDRSRAVKRALFPRPYRISTNTPLENAVQLLVKRAFPWFDQEEDFIFDETGFVTPKVLFDVGDDPWEQAQKFAQAGGAYVYFDGQGKCNLKAVPDPGSAGVAWHYLEGDNFTILELDRDLDDEVAYNGVTVSGKNSSTRTAVRHTAWDKDPESPTYYDPAYDDGSSSYGPVLLTLENEFITSDNQAELVALSQLRRHLGILEQVNFSAIPNFAHTDDDIVEIGRNRSKTNVVNAIDSITWGLSPGDTMTCSTRQRRVVS